MTDEERKVRPTPPPEELERIMNQLQQYDSRLDARRTQSHDREIVWAILGVSAGIWAVLILIFIKQCSII